MTCSDLKALLFNLKVVEAPFVFVPIKWKTVNISLSIVIQVTLHHGLFNQVEGVYSDAEITYLW